MADSGLVYRGSLFSLDFLSEAIRNLPEWKAIDDEAVSAFREELQTIVSRFPISKAPNEPQTEDDLIWPILECLGWAAFLRQQNLTVKGRDNVPDGILFPDAAAKSQANDHAEEWKRYEFGLAIVESKRWGRPLDRRSGTRGEELAPSTQMLRYLRRVDDLTSGGLRWGILTNGGIWRLYYQGARSVSEQFFEIDLAAVLGIAGRDEELFALNEDEKRHALRVFMLVFGRASFLPGAADVRTFHQRALDEGRFYEERVAESLSSLVFEKIFPELVRAIAKSAPDASLDEVRDAALILLYRLLFLLYAEDRDLLPVRDRRYDDYGLRDKVRGDIGKRKDSGDTFSSSAARYWSTVQDLSRAIDKGDASIGLPPYNGGLFDGARTPLLETVRIADDVMADVIDRLSFEERPDGRKYINYRDLSVQQLGSIYERLLEHEVRMEDDAIVIRPNIFARKGSGSYYTPDDLVRLILNETLEPLIAEKIDAFRRKAAELGTDKRPLDYRIGALEQLDPAEKLLELRICDPAMGSGHFLVSLVDYLTDNVIAAMAEAEATPEWTTDDTPYISPLAGRIDKIRRTILHNAEEKNWAVDPLQLDDRHIVRRMVLKRCVYGVDKNQMAVELAKVSLWLHTFTVGAPLSFLDHHLRCGDSLFGSWVRPAMDRLTDWGSGLLLHSTLTKAKTAATSMQTIEGLTDAEIAEAHRSADIFEGVVEMTRPLDTLISMVHAIGWLDLKDKADIAAIQEWLKDGFGDVVDVASGRKEIIVPTAPPPLSDAEQKLRAKAKKTSYSPHEMAVRFSAILAKARELIEEEHFLNWQVAFPGVWSDWESGARKGGFDAVIGNPPWDRMKLQQVEWFAARRREIALAQRASDRAKMIAKLQKDGDPLAADYDKASARAEAATRMAREGGDFPLLSGGDVNLYSLFVERALSLVKPKGMVGLLTPIGIATDKHAASFFSNLVSTNRIKVFFSFENRKGWLFPHIHHEEQPSILVFSRNAARFSSFGFCARVSNWIDFADSNRRFVLESAGVANINPNTGTAPLFRSRRDALIVTRIYDALPVLVRRDEAGEEKAWEVTYRTSFHMTNDSALFRTRSELEELEGAYPLDAVQWKGPSGIWIPLFEGKSVQLFNHRYASIRSNSNSVSGQGVAEPLSEGKLSDPNAKAQPRYWINEEQLGDWKQPWVLGFNDICNTNNARSLIVALIPTVACGNTLPMFVPSGRGRVPLELLAGNFGALVCDYTARQKIQSRHLNKYIVEQLPVVPPGTYNDVKFGKKGAGEIVREIVLELTYTAHDMAPFAKDMGHVDKKGEVLPPFKWDEKRRLKLRAKLDAIYFHLYGVTERDDVRYIYSTFPIVEREETEAYGSYRSRDLCLAWMNALAAGDPDAKIDL